MKSCTLCASEFEPTHGNARYCDLCRMSVCARCNKPFRRAQPHKVAYYCSRICMRNDTLRDYIEENHPLRVYSQGVTCTWRRKK